MIIEVHQSGECRVPARLINANDSFRSITVPVFSLIVRHPEHGTVLVDTGYDPRFIYATKRFPALLYRRITRMTQGKHQTLFELFKNSKDVEMEPKHIVVTHLHADHIAGVSAFNNSTVWMTKPAMELIHEHRRTSVKSLAHGFIPELLPSDILEHGRSIEFSCLNWEYRAHLPQGFDLFGDGTIIIVPLPGHARGHCGVMLKSTNLGSMLYLADAVWDIRAVTDYANSSRLTAWLHDTEPYQETIKMIRGFMHEFPDVKLFPSHCARSAAHLHSTTSRKGSC